MFISSPITLFEPSKRARKSIVVSKHVYFAFTISLLVMSTPILITTNSQLIAAPSPITPSTITDTSNYHSNISPTTSNIAQSPSASESSTPTVQGTLQIPRSFQSTDIVNSNGIYEITFITATAGAIKTIEMVFPAGTGIGPAGFIEKVGIGPGTFSKAGTTMTFNVQTPVNVPAGTFIRFELVNIKNPPTPSPTLQVSITTKDGMGNIIDGPTPTAVYNIKQIGTTEIADSAITTPKIADNSITSTKPAESFMKKVILLDNPAGHARGWDPDNIKSTFAISGETITDNTMITMFVNENSANLCSVGFVRPSLQNFVIECLEPVFPDAALNYVIENLPVHTP